MRAPPEADLHWLRRRGQGPQETLDVRLAHAGGETLFGTQQHGLVLEEYSRSDQRPDTPPGDGGQKAIARPQLAAQPCHKHRRIDNDSHSAILCDIV